MNEITIKQIIKDKKLRNQKMFCGLFALCGFASILLPFIKRHELSDKNFFVAIIFMLIVFGMPIGYFAGLRKIIQAIKLENVIKNKQITIEEDIVVSKRITAHNHSADIDSYCQISYKNYSKRSKKYCIVTRAEYEKINSGDKFFMVYENKKGELLYRYSVKEYQVGEELKETLLPME